MLRANFRLFWKLVVVSSLLSPFVLLSTSLLPSGSGNIVGRVANEMVYPFEATWHYSVFFLQKVWHRYIGLSNVARENEELRKALFSLNTKLLDYEEKNKEISRLRDILGFKERYEVEHEVAEVIGSTRDVPFETLRINKGSIAGIKIGMPLITGQGVLGRIIRVGLTHADVQLLIDANFYLDVLMQRTRARGVLRGEFGMNCSLRLNRRAEVKIGDTIITSGIIGGFPKGIPVGRVVRISYESDNITQIITVEPWVNYKQVEEVLILKTVDDETRKIMNTAGEAWLKNSIDSVRRGRG